MFDDLADRSSDEIGSILMNCTIYKHYFALSADFHAQQPFVDSSAKLDFVACVCSVNGYVCACWHLRLVESWDNAMC